MFFKFKLFVTFIIILSIAVPALAQESGGGESSNQQEPVQAIAQIVITAIILRMLSMFRLP